MIFFVCYTFPVIVYFPNIDNLGSNRYILIAIQIYLCSFFRLLAKFEVVLPLPEERYFVAAKIPDSQPDSILALCEEYATAEHVCSRRYHFPYIPMAMWARLITRLLVFADAACQSLPTAADRVSSHYESSLLQILL